MFEPRRESRPHLAFGYGPHFCAGAALARAEARAVIGAMVLCDPPVCDWDMAVTRSPSATFRRIAELRVSLAP